MNYQNRVVCIVACLSDRRFRRMKSALGSSFDRLEPDDRSYFCCRGNFDVRDGAEAAGDALSTSPEDLLSLGESLKIVVSLMEAEPRDFQKHVVVVVDEFADPGCACRSFARSFALDRERNTKCLFHVLDLGDEKPWLDEVRLPCYYAHVPDDPLLLMVSIRARYEEAP